MKGNAVIVSLELAKLAREKGFDEVTHFGYCYDPKMEGYYINYDPDYFNNASLWENHYAAPSREQLLVWLQKQDIFVVVDVDQTLEPKFVYKVTKHLGNGSWDIFGPLWSDLYIRYEQALEAGLTEGLNKM